MAVLDEEREHEEWVRYNCVQQARLILSTKGEASVSDILAAAAQIEMFVAQKKPAKLASISSSRGKKGKK